MEDQLFTPPKDNIQTQNQGFMEDDFSIQIVSFKVPAVSIFCGNPRPEK